LTSQGLKIELEELLGRRVDLLTFNSLHQLLKDKILKEQKPNSMRKDPKILIEHILECIGLIEEYLARKQGRISRRQVFT
jgi:hypothetical protein